MLKQKLLIILLFNILMINLASFWKMVSYDHSFFFFVKKRSIYTIAAAVHYKFITIIQHLLPLFKQMASDLIATPREKE